MGRSHKNSGQLMDESNVGYREKMCTPKVKTSIMIFKTIIVRSWEKRFSSPIQRSQSEVREVQSQFRMLRDNYLLKIDTKPQLSQTNGINPMREKEETVRTTSINRSWFGHQLHEIRNEIQCQYSVMSE